MINVLHVQEIHKRDALMSYKNKCLFYSHPFIPRFLQVPDPNAVSPPPLQQAVKAFAAAVFDRKTTMVSLSA